MSDKKYFERNLRICYLNAHEKEISAQRLHIENKLKQLGKFTLHPVSGLDDKNLRPCDLLIVAADKIPEDAFPKWLEGFSKKIELQASIWIPALIISESTYITLKSILKKAVQMNWYFDIISPQHLDSLPIRVGNLLRINDHLHELRRYEEAINSLSKQIDQVSETIKIRPERSKK